MVEHRDVVRARERPEYVAPDVTRQQLRGREDEHAQHKERDERQGESPQQEARHDEPPVVTRVVTSGSTERRVAEVNRALRVAIVALDRLRSRREVIVEI